MAIFEKFPYTDLHNLNLDWMINQFKEWEAKYSQYDVELGELRTAVETAQAALIQDEADLNAAIIRLNQAILDLPAVIREVVLQEIPSAVASQLPGQVDAKLPAEVQRQLPDEFEDWMDTHFTEPPIDPTMSMAYGVPSARAAGRIFTYLENLSIEGFNRSTEDLSGVLDGIGKIWDANQTDAILETTGATDQAAVHFDVVGGLTYRLSSWTRASSVPYSILFINGPVEVSTFSYKFISGIQRASISNYLVPGTTDQYDIQVPLGADVMLVNSRASGGAFSGPVVTEHSNIFTGGEVYRVLTADNSDFRFTGEQAVLEALDAGRSVRFKFPSSTGDFISLVVSSRRRAGYVFNVVMLSTDKELITANVDIARAIITNVRRIDIGSGAADGGTIINLDANQNNTFTGDISIRDLQRDLDMAITVWLSHPTDSSDAWDLRQVVEWYQDTNGLMIGVLSADQHIIYSVADDGNEGITLTTISSRYISTPAWQFTPNEGSTSVGTLNIGWTKLDNTLLNREPVTLNLGSPFGTNAYTTILFCRRITSTLWYMVGGQTAQVNGAQTAAWVLMSAEKSGTDDVTFTLSRQILFT